MFKKKANYIPLENKTTFCNMNFYYIVKPSDIAQAELYSLTSNTQKTELILETSRMILSKIF